MTGPTSDMFDAVLDPTGDRKKYQKYAKAIVGFPLKTARALLREHGAKIKIIQTPADYRRRKGKIKAMRKPAYPYIAVRVEQKIIVNAEIATDMSALGSAMAAPIRHQMDYAAVGRKAFWVDPLP